MSLSYFSYSYNPISSILYTPPSTTNLTPPSSSSILSDSLGHVMTKVYIASIADWEPEPEVSSVIRQTVPP